MINKVYEGFRLVMPHYLKGFLSKAIINAGVKPTVNKKFYNHFEKGIVVFSSDFELAWAFRYSKLSADKANDLGLKERKNFPLLLDGFNKYGIPVTWATVGHLFLQNCSKGRDDLPHPEMPRPPYFINRNWSFEKGDWYQHDPCSDQFKAQAWYASDLIELVQNSPVKHEIASHSFSHIDCSSLNCPKDLMDAELEMCIELAEMVNVNLKSFVFPGGTEGNYKSLKEHGFKCYRKPMKYHIDIPYIDDYGLVAIPSSYGLNRDEYGWSATFHKKIIRSFIRKTIKSRQVCHFWFHPSLDEWYLSEIFPFLLKIVSEEVKKGNLEVLTMHDLAKKILNK